MAWQGLTWVRDGLAQLIVSCCVAEEILLGIFLPLLLMPWEADLLGISSPFDLAQGLIRQSPSSIFVLQGGKVVVAAFRGHATSS